MPPTLYTTAAKDRLALSQLKRQNLCDSVAKLDATSLAEAAIVQTATEAVESARTECKAAKAERERREREREREKAADKSGEARAPAARGKKPKSKTAIVIAGVVAVALAIAGFVYYSRGTSRGRTDPIFVAQDRQHAVTTSPREAPRGSRAAAISTPPPRAPRRSRRHVK